MCSCMPHVYRAPFERLSVVYGGALSYTSDTGRDVWCFIRGCVYRAERPLPTRDADPSPIMTSAAFEESWLTGPTGTRFYTRTYKADQPKALLVFVHGFAEHVGRYGHAHVEYPQRGITVFTYDARGFGKTALDVANKSKGSSYGKTSWKEQFGDIEWAIEHAREEVPGVPIFLMGHSMVGVWRIRMLFCGSSDLVWVAQGGGNVLGFVTRKTGPPSPDTVKLLSGVIASSPLLVLSTPASSFQRWLGRKARPFLPNLLVPTPMNEGVRETLTRYPDVLH